MDFFPLFLVAAVVRIALIIYGDVQDIYFKVKYTDIDYVVFSDAAKYVINGTSPYSRATYRYTPLLAFLMTPNSFLHPSFGKIFFSICDLIIGWLIIKINKTSLEEYPALVRDTAVKIRREKPALLPVFLWLFNPISLSISTRGNVESFQAVLVLATLLCIMRKYHFFGGLLFGFAVHFKIYPVIFSLPISLYIIKELIKMPSKSWRTVGLIRISAYCLKELFWFLFASGSVIVGTTLFFYHWYQMEFIEHTYLYHLKRTDIKHNFSPYFYVLYLTSNSPWSGVIGLLAFFPQAISVIVLGIKYHTELPVACFLQAFAFVTFNKVCTSQYFIWYLSILPTAMVYFKKDFYSHSPLIIFLWMSAQGIWLFLAYLLEFQAWDTFFFVWLASIWFLIVNSYILLKLISSVASMSNLTTTEAMKKDE